MERYTSRVMSIMYRNFGFLAGAIGLVLCAGCERPSMLTRKPPPPPPKYATIPPEEAVKLPEREYLMRKATMGARSERLEALDVIDRSGDPDYLPFLLDRLMKEDDRLLQMRIMRALAKAQDIRAVEPLRKMARWDSTRLAVVAVESLYDLGDDSMIPKLIRLMRETDQFPELSGIAHRSLKKIYEVDLPNNLRIWNNYYRSHRLAPYQKLRWYANFRPPLPPVVEGTSKVQPGLTGGPRLPQEDVRVRRHIVSAYEFYKPDEP